MYHIFKRIVRAKKWKEVESFWSKKGAIKYAEEHCKSSTTDMCEDGSKYTGTIFVGSSGKNYYEFKIEFIK